MRCVGGANRCCRAVVAREGDGWWRAAHKATQHQPWSASKGGPSCLPRRWGLGLDRQAGRGGPRQAGGSATARPHSPVRSALQEGRESRRRDQPSADGAAECRQESGHRPNHDVLPLDVVLGVQGGRREGGGPPA